MGNEVAERAHENSQCAQSVAASCQSPLPGPVEDETINAGISRPPMLSTGVWHLDETLTDRRFEASESAQKARGWCEPDSCLGCGMKRNPDRSACPLCRSEYPRPSLTAQHGGLRKRREPRLREAVPGYRGDALIPTE